MKFCIIVPVHNEEAFIGQMLESVVQQTLRPQKVIVVDDSSTDGSREIIQGYVEKYPFIKYLFHRSSEEHQPGTKVVQAFYKGYETLDEDFDLIGKFDADIILPSTYFEEIIQLFNNDKQIGMAGGNLYIQPDKEWVFENISGKDKVRGPIKLYRKECFEQIGKLKPSIGWDTVDELLARYYGWEIKTIPSLHVKHLKPTGKAYSKEARFKQGEAFYKMRYGWFLSAIASMKMAVKRRSFSDFSNGMKGYSQAKRKKIEPIVSEEEGRFIRKYRWKNIKSKLGI